MEGVMMKNKDEYAVAVRKPNNEISVEKSTHKDFSEKVKLFKLPIFRGMLAFVDSMVIGVKVLNYSASFFEEEEDKTQNEKKKNKSKMKADKRIVEEASDFEIEEVTISHTGADSPEHTDKNGIKAAGTKKEDRSNALLMALAVLISIVLSVALFMVLPVFLTNLLSAVINSRLIMNLLEGIIRLAIFIGYIILAARMPEIKRVFMYHGAEHKTINCLENGLELTVQNVKKQSKRHKRCGTSFMLLVILISLVFFMLLPSGDLVFRILSRILLVPFIAGVSYEFIRLAGKSENKVVNIISKPGLWMQGLTTKEPDASMIEVAIESVGAVFDWKEFVKASKENGKGKNRSAKKPSKQMKQNTANNRTPVSKQKIENNRTSVSKQNTANNRTSASEQETPVKQEAAFNKENIIKQADKTGSADAFNKAGIPDSSLKKPGTSKPDNLAKGVTVERSRITPVKGLQDKDDEEDDEILKALDKYFDNGLRDSDKASGDK